MPIWSSTYKDILFKHFDSDYVNTNSIIYIDINISNVTYYCIIGISTLRIDWQQLTVVESYNQNVVTTNYSHLKSSTLGQ